MPLSLHLFADDAPQDQLHGVGDDGYELTI